MNKCCIYGLGVFFEQNKDFILNNWIAEKYIDNKRTGQINNIDIETKECIHECDDIPIIIMSENIHTIFSIASELEKEMSITKERILLGIDIVTDWKREKGIEKIVYSGNGKICIAIDGFECEIGSVDEYNNVTEVLVNKIYQYRINNTKKDIVIDVGMNIGDSTWFFLNKSSVNTVYAFEPFAETYNRALKNLSNYMELNDRLKCYNFGISNITEERSILYNSDMSCGMSSISDVSVSTNQKYKFQGLASDKNDSIERIHIKRAFEVFSDILSNTRENNYVLKMDCEGEEYCIIEDLFNTGLLHQFDFMMIEWHYQGNEQLINYIEEAGFSWWGCNENSNIGLLYAFKAKA